ncbi:epoxide hydrolase family protein [Microlunatus parietis]|uniref:Pimeloyl-ACP methyl ester carboxylesterase n=1 Tax=Microlunatus parietis TaxID=682979 RepID=A0A7Y9LBM1_9ACTN|nr:epoxide hydrolase family protein [Microlunatus parietis]NYE70993.1 pimeloyl-ACP methyl ester carboxylesterase [Microlunatus parietis]
MTTQLRPYRIEIPQADLDDLQSRLANARLPRSLPGDGWSRGVPTDYLRELADYWRTGFDWRAQEARLNAFPQFVTTIDDVDVHFLHVRSGAPDAVPLLITHGWPNSVAEFVTLIPELIKLGYDVVVPHVPGFGFSGQPQAAGFGVGDVGRLWAELMRRLGCQRYGVQGGDLGVYVAQETAKADPEHVIGVHLDSGIGLPTEDLLPDLNAEERAVYDQIQQWAGQGVDHHLLLRHYPQTMAYGWNDSPVGLLAWLMQKFHEFTFVVPEPQQAIDRDLLLINASIYWFTQTAASSSWFMFNSERFVWPGGQQAAPTGVYSGPPGIRRLAELSNDVRHWGTDNPGSGHFIAMEQPAALAADIDAFFASL